MELHEFVRETLAQIVRGVSDAQAATSKYGAEIAPPKSRMYGNTREVLYTDEGVIEAVAFDVAVTVATGTASKGGVGVFVAPIALGARGESNEQDMTVSRIRFSVPLTLPTRGATAKE